VNALLSCDGLDAGYGSLSVVRGLSLSLREGEIVALIGPNGAGKTTTLLTLAGILPPLAGTVEILGAPLPRRRPHAVAQRGLSLVPDDRALYGTLDAADHLRVAARGKGRDQRIADVLDHFPGLRRRLGVPAGALSGGEQQMLALARALVNEPRILLIDELSMGLAPRIVVELLAIVRTVADERRMSVLMVEQHIQLALAVAERALVLVHGELALAGPARELAAAPERLEASYLGV
jgi:branched-chain amino acid transport system ATP-binding protein